MRGFWERFRVERGQEIGPRIFQVGQVIYGAGSYEDHQDIATMEEAYAALIRIKAEGGPASYSYKNYNLPSRASRQRLLLAARTGNLSMLCVPEGVSAYLESGCIPIDRHGIGHEFRLGFDVHCRWCVSRR